MPINGVGTADVSDAYPDLFAPAVITFSIWGLIYLLLGAHVIFQLGLFGKDMVTLTKNQFTTVGVYFAVSSIANTVWVFLWHYDLISLSLVAMVVILLCLIRIVQETNSQGLIVRLPFSVYFGWITVATIANVTTVLVSIGWNGFGLSEVTWMVIILVVGAVVGSVVMIRYKDMAYGLVFLWAYTGILLKHISQTGFGGEYPFVIGTVIVCLVLLLAAEAYTLKGQLQPINA